MVTIEHQWQTMVSRSFEPRQWYERDEDDCKGGYSEGLKVWVYRRTSDGLTPGRDGGGLWMVGFYDPQGAWHSESEYRTPAEAANRVRWLNGGAG